MPGTTTVWAAIVPALLARASRKRFGSPLYRVWGGTPLIIVILLFGAVNAIARIRSEPVTHLLSSFASALRGVCLSHPSTDD